MASDPERPIEKLLRACAEKRRDEAGAPFEMHPATRRLLQSEAAQRFAKAPGRPEPAGGWLQHWWPRLGWSLAGAAALAVLVFAFIPGRTEKPELLARNEASRGSATPAELQPSSTADQVAPAAPAQANPPQPSARVDVEQSFAKATETTVGPSEPSAAPRPQPLAGRARDALQPEPRVTLNAPVAPAPSSVPAPNLAGAAGALASTRPPESTVVSAAPSVQAAAGQETLARRYGLVAGTKAEFAPGAGAAPTDDFVRFVQTPSPDRLALADSTSRPTPVLSSFQVRQSGTAVQMIDGDGSVYTGSLQAAAADAGSLTAPPERPAPTRALRLAEAKGRPTAPLPAAASAQTWSNYFFRVVGTNQTLNKRIVFTGNLVCPANFPMPRAEADRLSAGQAGGSISAPSNANSLPLSNARISGKALLDNRQEIQINALPAKP